MPVLPITTVELSFRQGSCVRGFRSLIVVGLLSLCGCVMFDVGVTNPVAGLTTVAVVPFFNLSAERSVDGRRFAQAYFTELQKTPGFQVLPTGVVEQAIYDNQLELNNPDDALKLADILKVDAVVVGAVTDYSPYYPPRVGLQVSWYSPRPWNFQPGLPIAEDARKAAIPRRNWSFWKTDETEACPAPGTPIIRGQSETTTPASSVWNRWMWWRGDSDTSAPVIQPTGGHDATISGAVPAVAMGSGAFDPRQPFMSYTRLFDGADPQLTARLRDYVELSGDLRSGGWQGYLSRSDDFLKFTAHLMVVEMLQLHGGEAKRRIVVKARRYR